MTPSIPIAAVLLALASAVASPAPSPTVATAPEALADSTVYESWQLANGLRVATRHVPGGQLIAITVGYAYGSDLDPAGREGLAALLAEVQFTAAAGQVPERNRQELESLRPRGWGIAIRPRLTLMSEMAGREQFPGVLVQIAARMQGVLVTEQGVGAARAAVQREAGRQYLGPLDVSLHNQARALAAGEGDERLLRRASARGIEGLTPRQVQEELRRIYVPANAALCIAGNLEGMNVHALVEKEFAGISGGTALAAAQRIPLAARERVLQRPGVTQPAGVIALLAPPLTDPQHPAFFIDLLLVGNTCNTMWSGTPPGFPSRFQYALMDEPELAYFYPPVKAAAADAASLRNRLGQAVEALHSTNIVRETYEAVTRKVAWLAGGPMPPDILSAARTESGVLNMLAAGMATRVLGEGESFWTDYRRRLESPEHRALGYWVDYFKDPKNQAVLIVTPRP